jgi:ATP-dependent helicase/nuclease subunit B
VFTSFAHVRKAIRGQGLSVWQALLHNAPSPVLDILCAEILALPPETEIKPFVYWLDMHLRLAELWGKDTLWQGNEGEVLAEYLDAMRAHAADYLCSLEDYIGIFTQGLHQQTVRLSYGQHPRVHILGLIEARMLSFDHVVLAGLNEGTWPEAPMLDPWMSPNMRVRFGLPSPYQHLGQTAHDFVQLASQPRVTLLRCERNGGTPTNPSRWLLRVQTILKMLDAESALEPQLPWNDWARSLDAVDGSEPCEAPWVTVLPSALPLKLSATNIELWIADPYAFYAKKVLHLYALGDLDAELGAMERGNIFHAVLDKLGKEFAHHWPPEARERFIQSLGEGFIAQGCTHDTWHIMLPRMQVLAAEVWLFEQQRRREITAFYCEKRGDMALTFQNYKPHLQAKADKIEVLPDHTLRILDYKTGKIPTKVEVEFAIKPQLLVEAIIAFNKGYTDIAPTYTREIGYIKITEGSELLNAQTTTKLADVNTILAHQQGLLDFIAAYLQDGAQFHSAPRPALLQPSPDYARLARVAEWSKGEIEQEDAG